MAKNKELLKDMIDFTHVILKVILVTLMNKY